MGGRRRAFVAVAAVLGTLVSAALTAADVSGPTELLSLGSNPAPVTARGPEAAISGDGRYVAFSSDGRDLDATDTNPYSDIFVRDRQTGGLARITKAPDGSSANGGSTLSAGGVSGDGNIVVFTSTAFNLGPHDVNKVSDVYAYDRSANSIEMISGGSGGPLDADLESYDAAVSADGRYVTFTSKSYDIVPGDLNNKPDVFIHDRSTDQTKLVSRTSAGLPANNESALSAISADGSKVAFVSSATDLVAGDSNGKNDVFVYDVASEQVTRASVSSSGVQGNGHSQDPFISGDGRYVGFSSLAKNLGGVKRNGANDYALYIRDLSSGTVEVPMPDYPGTWPNGNGLENSQGSVRNGSISSDGRHVAFQTNSTKFVTGDSTEVDVFVLDRATERYTVVTRSPSGGVVAGPSTAPQISADGSAVAFLSSAKLTGTSTGAPQVYARPLSAEAVAADADGDSVGNIDDNCPLTSNTGQEDLDADTRGDVCDFEDDSDGVVDPLEDGGGAGFENQGTDPLDADSDDDGVNDWLDDYPNDGLQSLGLEHQTRNHPKFETDEGSGEPLTGSFGILDWKADTKKFETRLQGRGLPGQSYSLVVFRRARFVREATVCTAKADSNGLFGCTKTLPLSFFTHAAILRGSVEIDRDKLEHERAPLTGRGSD